MPIEIIKSVGLQNTKCDTESNTCTKTRLYIITCLHYSGSSTHKTLQMAKMSSKDITTGTACPA